MKKLSSALLLMMAFIALTGCARTRYPSYYTLNVPPAPDPPAQPGVRPSIAVQEFRSPAYLHQGPIIYRVTPEQIGFYEYHRWAADPRTVVTGAVLEHLRADGQFSVVTAYDGHADMDYVLSGRLEKLEEVDTSEGVKVEVAISAQIMRGERGASVWSNAVSEVGTVSQRNVPGVVSQMNRLTEVAITKLLSTIPKPLPVSAR
jgi:ABC-type uncharacterized transport system auxiliary subunit